MLKKFLFSILAITSTAASYAEERSNQEMLDIARTVLHSSNTATTQHRINATSDLRIIESRKNLTVVGNPSSGIVIVANDKEKGDVLGVSYNVGNIEQKPCGYEWWLNAIDEALSRNGIVGSSDNPCKVKANVASNVAPLLTCTWGQNSPYNSMCPTNCLGGCVAVAMAQVMYYHKYPSTGVGSNSVTYNGTQYSANFGGAVYDWDNMLDHYYSGISYSSAQKNAVAQLVYHCGVAVNMNYGTSFSGAFDYFVSTTLPGNFKYDDSTIKYDYRYLHTNQEWMSIIYSELSEGRPIVYSGSAPSESNGHCFVLDGYNSNGLVHVNWGWDGACDGYFDMSNLVITQTGQDYSDGQAMCYGIQPLNNGNIDNPDPSVDEGGMNGHEYVDLGLPSGKLWAKYNFGSNTEEGFGTYVQWSNHSIVKQQWGDAWSTPTLSDATELVNKCKWTWYTKNGTPGYRVEGPNGNTIFLPAAGWEIQPYGIPNQTGSLVGYWTSTPSSESGFAYAIYGTSSSAPNANSSYNSSVLSFPIRPVANGGSSTVAVSSVSLDKTTCNLSVGDRTTLTATVFPSNASNKALKWSSSNESVATVSQGNVTAVSAGEATITVSSTDGSNKSTTCKVVVSAAGPSETIDGHEYVDLGLPSGKLWSKYNYGSKTEEGFGTYFPWSDNGTIKTQWGNKWSTPTRAEAQELISNCTWTWESKNGTPGYRVKGKNGNSIFLPAAGWLIGDYGVSQQTGTVVGLWTSTMSSSAGFAYALYGSSSSVANVNTTYNTDICYYPIRPVAQPIVQEVLVSSVTLNVNELSLKVGQSSTLQTTILPANATNKQIEWTSSNTEVVVVNNGVVQAKSEGTATITAKTTDGSQKFAMCNVSVSARPAEDYEYVDMGLPSGLCWATCNVGASKPEEFGEYFAWGETKQKENRTAYDWSTYKYCNGSETNLTKYTTKPSTSANSVDNKRVLDLDDDAAHVNWGGDWRMPTREEFAELNAYCTKKYTQRNGVPGYEFSANNGNKLFLPQAGMYTLSGYQSNSTQGRYWTSSLSPTNDSYASYYLFDSSMSPSWYMVNRSYGHSVRPVIKPTIKVNSIKLNHSEYTLNKGENIQLVATLLPENATNKEVKWSTDNEDVIMVSSSGRCVYMADGRATVTATTCDGSSLCASCVFNCTDGIITITTYSPDLEFFTTDGRRINEMQNGVNIIRTEDGKTVKVLKM